MAKYTGPIHKLCRREGVPLCDSPKCPARGKRKYPPGVHGPKRGYPRNQSIYAKQLRAKQRAKRMYGMMERQFKRFFRLAEKTEGNTGENLLKLLEARLDNVVYRLGLGGTRGQARQMVNHRHILVNQRKVNIPSYIVKPEDIISLSPKALKNSYVQDKLAITAKAERPGWLVWDDKKYIGKLTQEPEITDLIEALNPSMIVELYSK
jgi:small subunit ribosomal protein S4